MRGCRQPVSSQHYSSAGARSTWRSAAGTLSWTPVPSAVRAGLPQPFERREPHASRRPAVCRMGPWSPAVAVLD